MSDTRPQLVPDGERPEDLLDTAERTRRQERDDLLTIRNLTRQLENERAKIAISQRELDDITRIRAEHEKMKEQQDKIAIWLRENKKTEIERGDHVNMGGLANVVIGYMRNKSLRPWWKFW